MLTDIDLLARLENFADHFTERKTRADSRDWKKTLVAFANSTPLGYPAVIFVGVRNDGSIEGGLDSDQLSKDFTRRTADVFPGIYYVPKALSKGTNPFLAVIVPGSELRPHFAGLSYVRKGSETVGASDAQFDELIAQRSSKTYKILEWKGRSVRLVHAYSPYGSSYACGIVVACNQFYVTIEFNGPQKSIPLSFVDISFHHESPEALTLMLNRPAY